jgi:site-specific DNA recombinase
MSRQRGLKVQKSQIWSLLRNPVYCGKVFIAAYKNELAHCVAGIHTPLISEHLFNEVQDVLRGRKRKVRVDAKYTITENLPLRGFLVCKVCGNHLTGSGSKGNGGVYYYYHCSSAGRCKERFKASDANEAFI